MTQTLIVVFCFSLSLISSSYSTSYPLQTLDRQESQRRTSITCSLAVCLTVAQDSEKRVVKSIDWVFPCHPQTFVKDTLAALDAPPNALTDDRLYATVQERVAHLKLAPQVQVYSAPKAGQAVFDARTGEALKLHGKSWPEMAQGSPFSLCCLSNPF